MGRAMKNGEAGAAAISARRIAGQCSARAARFAARLGCKIPATALQPASTFSSSSSPPPRWPDALPVGNGRLGAMVFGNTAKERLQLNEETVWIGERRDRNNPQASRTPEVRSTAHGRQSPRGRGSRRRGHDGRSRPPALLPNAR